MAQSWQANSGSQDFRRDAVALAQTLYERTGGANIDMTFSFDPDHPIRDIGAVAERIAKLAHLVSAWPNGQIQRHHFEEIPELKFAYLYARQLQYSDEPDPKFPNGQPDASEGFSVFAEYQNRREARALRSGIYKPLPFPGKWKLGQLHSVGFMSVDRLREIVRQKEAKARGYTGCDEYWLLVVVDFMNPAQEQEIRVDGAVIASDVFRRIVVYKPFFDQVLEVTRDSGAHTL
jgi:hypothetical protein